MRSRNIFRGVCYWLLLLECLLLVLVKVPSGFCLHQEDYIDFLDMGTYDHGSQANKWAEERKLNVETMGMVAKAEPEAVSVNVEVNIENGSRPMLFLQRVIKSLMRQMNVQSHVFGPGEAITIDLQAEIKYEDYLVLNQFVDKNNVRESYLTKVDDIMSNMIHVVEHNVPQFEILNFILSLPIFHSLQFWLVLLTMVVISFLIIMLSVRSVYASNNVLMLFYGFLIIFILSCIWTFYFMYEEAKAATHAKMAQTQTPPKDCDYDNLGFLDSLSYYIRVNLRGAKDHCQQYYATRMTDPFWSVNPLEAISKSFAVLVFHPADYIGGKIGSFFGGIMLGIPWYLQPLIIIVVFGFVFISLFGYKITSPFFTIEPASNSRHRYIENAPGSSGIRSTPNSPAIKARTSTELMERPERKVVKSRRDAATDMDDFEAYLTSREDECSGSPRFSARSSTIYSNCQWILNYLLHAWTILTTVLDILLRQCPVENEENLEDEGNAEGVYFDVDVGVGGNDQVVLNDDQRQPIDEEADLVIQPRRRHRPTDEERDCLQNKENGVQPVVDNEAGPSYSTTRAPMRPRIIDGNQEPVSSQCKAD